MARYRAEAGSVMRRVVVVGAGINGLVAAHYLRRAGCQVTVLERADRAGGTSATRRAAGWAVIRAQPNSKRRSVAAAWRTVRLVYSQLIKGTCICTACVPILRTPEEISVYVGALHKVACLAAGTNFGR